MKTPCEAAQRQILALTDPDRPPISVQSHVEGCSTCRDWQQQVVRIDRAAATLPFPPSTTKAAFLQRLGTEPARRQRLRGRTWQLTAAWAAAAVLLFVLLYNLAQTPTVAPPPQRPAAGADPWLASLLRKHQTLAQAGSTRQQVEGLADLAEDVRDHTQQLVRFVEVRDLQPLAKLYGQAIQTSVQRGGELPRNERRQVLEPLARQLEKARDAAQRQARVDRVGSADHPLITIATAAQLGKDRLDLLLKEETRGFTSGPVVAALPSQWLVRAVVGARADDAPRAMTTAEDLELFRRNRALIETLVASGIHLAAKGNLVARAGHCTPLVEALGQEIADAAAAKDGARVAELTGHLRVLLTQGVAFNLSKGGVNALPGSELEQQLLLIGGDIVRQLNRIEERLARTAYANAMQDIRVGRREIEIAIQGRGAAK